MTTYLHSAAMGLLSRTLQALLSKYLAEVDVEGVALPSLTAGNSTGWGVRLVNVKLRNGTKLMDLHAPLPSEKTKKKSPTKERPSHTTTTNTSTSSARQRQQRDTVQNKQQRGSNGRKTNSAAQQLDDRSQASDYKKVDGNGVQLEGSGIAESRVSAADTSSVSMPLHQSMKDGLETVATEIETDSETVTSNTKTIVRKHSSWLRSWYYGCGESVEEAPLMEEDEDNMNDDEGGAGGIIDDYFPSPIKHDDFIDDAACMPPSIPLLHVDPLAGSNSFDCDSSPVDSHWNRGNGGGGEDGEAHHFDDEYMDDDEIKTNNEQPQQQRQPMMLRLGKGGTIGTLDVRLVGKTIHVLIEDATLTIEVVRLATPVDHHHHHPNADENTALPNATNTPKKKKKTPPAAVPSPPKTAGDHVLAENAIARIFSAIPNLFLRDIRIRLVIRDQVVSGESCDSDEGGSGNPSSSATLPDEANISEYYDSNDTIIELTIELLSVNDGKDFLLNFGGTVEGDLLSSASSSSDDDDSVGAKSGGKSDRASYNNNVTAGVETISNNEYLTKRIRTGRGPEGGISLRIYQVGYDLFHYGETNKAVMWARDVWNASTQFVVARCSGLDLQARIFLGTKKELSISNHGYYNDDYDYEDFTVNAMLFGVDYIVPGPQPPLPPISNDHVANNLSDEETWTNSGATTFVTDSNGIQSCRLPSPFHKVARGLVPRHCSGAHLPCEWCHRCWANDHVGSARPDVLDASTPLGGLVVHVSVRDPLEINVDRYNLVVLGLLLSLFTKGPTESDDIDDATSAWAIPNDSQRSLSSHYSKSSNNNSYQTLDESSRSMMGVSGRSLRTSPPRAPNPLEKHGDYNVESSFPTYMQPEKIQMLGLHLAEIKFRVHVMQRDGEPEGGKTYCYWEIRGKCITMDHQQLEATVRPFQDLRLDVGHLSVAECKGVDRKQIIVLGVRQRIIEFDEMTVETFMTAEKKHKRSPWPTTAAALLDVPPPLESLVYADRDSHGLQLRYISVLDPDEDCDRIRNDANVRVGLASVDVQFAIKDDIIRVIDEARSSIFGPPDINVSLGEAPKLVDSVMKYKLIADGGRVCMDPLISVTLPRTTIEGELSTKAGFSFETFLDRVQFSYGKPSAIRAMDRGLSLQQLAKLPENVRLRVLLFLKDLKPLEAALGLPESSNTFLRCRAVNKGIVNMSKAVANRMNTLEKDPTIAGRRQELMNEMLALDDDTLEALLDAHRQNHERKYSDII